MKVADVKENYLSHTSFGETSVEQVRLSYLAGPGPTVDVGKLVIT